MLYLIWWPPRCWKTTLARMLWKAKGIPYIPWDYLKRIVKEYTSEEKAKESTPVFSKKMTNDQNYKHFSPREMKEEYLRSAHHCRAAFSVFIDYALHDWYDFIIEGYQLLPELVAKYKWNPNISTIFLYKENPWLIYEWVKKSKDPNDRLKLKCTDETIKAASEMISQLWVYFNETAHQHGFASYNTEEDFFDTLKKIAKEI